MLARRVLPCVAMLVLLLGGARIAIAETLVMVSPPPELDAAVRSSLAPWRVKIIVIDMASGTPAELALTQGAGFVVWRDEHELVLWDAVAGTGERREIPPTLDDASAAALALSIKTWMNLGAPPPPDPPTIEYIAPPPPPPPPGDGPAVRGVTRPPPAPPLLRVDAATGVRANTGNHGRTDLRIALAASLRVGPIDAVVSGELGPAHPASAEQGVGELSTLVLGAHARWPFALSPSVVLAPGLGVVLERDSFSGIDTVDRPFSSSALGVGFDATGIVEWRWKRFLVGAEVGATALPLAGELQDRNVRMDTPAHIETRGLARLGVILR